MDQLENRIFELLDNYFLSKEGIEFVKQQGSANKYARSIKKERKDGTLTLKKATNFLINNGVIVNVLSKDEPDLASARA